MTTPNPQQQMQALATRSATLAKTLDERILAARIDEKSIRMAAHDLERAVIAFKRDEEVLVDQARQALGALIK